MSGMTRNAVHQQPDLFEDNGPSVQLPTLQADRLATLVQVLLSEIAVALAAGRNSDD
jgi:hypothetical protein